MIPPVGQFALTYVAGLWVGHVFLVPRAMILACGLSGLVALRVRGWAGVLLSGCLIGGAVGAWSGAVRASGCATVWRAGRHAAKLRVHDAPDRRGLTQATVLSTPEHCTGPLRVQVTAGAVPPGATILAVGAFHRRGAFRIHHHRVLGVPQAWRFRLRAAVHERLTALYGARTPVVDALVLGRRADVPSELRADFAASGLAHLLAISGLHVGLLAGWFVLGARLVGARRTAWLWASGLVWFYVITLGFPAPATRAATFISLHALARSRQRNPTPGAVLAVAVLTVVTVNPAAVTAVGAWLSVAAVWGTSLAQQVLRRGRLPSKVVALIAISCGATLATAPITAFAFGSVAPIGIAANLFAVPLAGVAVPGVFGSLIAGAPLAGGAGLVLAAVERVAHVGARVPGGHVTGSPGAAFAAPWLAVLVLAAWIVIRRPTWITVWRRTLVAAAACSWMLVAVERVTGRDGGTGLTLYVLDVGQGDAIAIRTPHGRWALVDAGPRTAGSDAGRRVVVPFLRRQGVQALDLLIVSHGDADHLGGVPVTVAALAPRLLVEPGQPLGTALYLEHLSAAAAAGSEWHAARAGDTLVVDGVRFAVLHPTERWMQRETRPNENSLVVKVSYGAFDVLLTGDVGWPVESLLVAGLERVELLKVGHHGSAGSSADAFLAAVAPAAAVVSVGARNRYGHPAPSVLRRFADREIPIYRTDRGGTVTVRSDGRYFQIDQRPRTSPLARLLCRLHWLPSRASSSTRNACTPRRPATSPAFFTTWPSRPNTSRRTSDALGSSASLAARAR